MRKLKKAIRFLQNYHKQKLANGCTGSSVVVEFFGVTGTGKSTLAKNFYESFADSEKIDLKGILKAYSWELMQWDAAREALFSERVKRLMKSGFPAHDKMRLTNYYYNILNIDFLLSNKIANKIAILEEGIFHNFTEEILEFVENNPEAQSVLKSKKIIFL